MNSASAVEPRKRVSERSLANLRPFAKGDARTRELAARGGRATKKPKVTELLRERTEARAAEILRPYLEGLALEPRPGWSPATTLDFYRGQAQLSEKLLDRVEGRPVARDKLVGDADDLDALSDLSPPVLVRLVAAIACTGSMLSPGGARAMTLGEKVYALRMDRDMSYERLAGRAGCTPGWLQAVEEGRIRPQRSGMPLLSLALALEVELEELRSSAVSGHVRVVSGLVLALLSQVGVGVAS